MFIGLEKINKTCLHDHVFFHDTLHLLRTVTDTNTTTSAVGKHVYTFARPSTIHLLMPTPQVKPMGEDRFLASFLPLLPMGEDLFLASFLPLLLPFSA
jgi:hypothetical protein